MALDPLTPEQAKAAAEFSPDVSPPELGHPEDDLPFTIRMQPPWTWERRHDPATPRVVKVDRTTQVEDYPWAMFDPEGRARTSSSTWLSDDEVRDWPIQHPVMVAAVMAKLTPQEPPRKLAGAELVGDMGVEAFKGGAGE